MDILLPVDAVLGLLANAVEREREAQMPGMVDPHLAHREGLAAAAAAAAASASAAGAATAAPADVVGGVAAARRGKTAVSESVPQGGVGWGGCLRRAQQCSPAACAAATEIFRSCEHALKAHTR